MSEDTNLTTIVDILRIATSSDSSIRSNVVVDGVDTTERVHVNLQARESLVRAWLECLSIASRRRVEVVNGSKGRISILSGTSSTSVGGDEALRGVPIRLYGRQ